MIPLLHDSSELQLAEQPSPSIRLPSSQISARAFGSAASGPCLTSLVPLPHCSLDLQSAAQPSPLAVLPSSHTSPALTSTSPSPHTSLLQTEEQPSPSTRLPSSHCSPGPTSALPQPPEGTHMVRSPEHSVPTGQNRPFAHSRALFGEAQAASTSAAGHSQRRRAMV